jgi:hypothetical protein
MQFMLAAIPLFAALAAASPFAPSAAAGSGAAHANGDIKFPVPEDYTVKQAAAKCGNNAQLSCCNKVTYAGDTTTIDSGLLAGLLSDLIGSGSGSQGIGLFDECSKLDIPSKSPTEETERIDTNLSKSLSTFRTLSTRSASRTLLAARTPKPMLYVFPYPRVPEQIS